MIDVIVATITGREDSLERCLASYAGHRPIIVKDEPSCGAAWLRGMGLSDAPYVHLTNDDLEVHPGWEDACVEAVENDALPCPVVYRPDGSIESCGGDMQANHCLVSHLQEDWTPCDFTTVPFYSRIQAEAIGMLPIHYYSDVWTSYRGRQYGYETVIRTGYAFTHHHENTGRLAPTTEDRRTFTEALNG